MDVILHVGAHRTATTSLQRMIGAEGAMLSRRGMAYWGPKRMRSGLCHGLMGSEDAILPWQANRARQRIARRARAEEETGHRTLFVSDENILGAMRPLLRDAALYPEAGQRVARFADGLAAYPVTIGLATRGYADWWASLVAFRMLRDAPNPGPGLINRLMRQPRRWRHLVADLAQAVPGARIVVWTHEAMAARPDRVVKALTGRRGLPLHPLADAVQNPAPSVATLAAHLAERAGGPAPLPTHRGRFMPFTATQRARLAAQYAEDLAWLAAGAGGLAEYIDDPAMDGVTTEQGRGRPNDRPDRDRQHRRMA